MESGTLVGPGNSAVRGLVFSPNGETLAGVAEETGEIIAWDLASGVQQWVLASETAVSKIAFSADGTLLAGHGNNNQIQLWNMASGQAHLTLTNASGAAVTDFAFSPVEMTLASVDTDANITLWLWDADTGAVNPTTLIGHDDIIKPIKPLVFSADGIHLASGGKDAAIKLWDVPTGQEEVTIPDAHLGLVITGLTFSPDGSPSPAWVRGIMR